jgi:hypothetical protein
MKVPRFFCALFGLLLLLDVGTGSSLFAQPTKEKTIDSGRSKIQVKVLAGNADVVSVKPYIQAKEGKKKGRLWLDVVVKNTASEPNAFSVFGQAKTDTGGWLGGMTEVPKDGKLEPGKETTAKVRTRYEGEQVPKEIRVEILPAQSGPPA